MLCDKGGGESLFLVMGVLPSVLTAVHLVRPEEREMNGQRQFPDVAGALHRSRNQTEIENPGQKKIVSS